MDPRRILVFSLFIIAALFSDCRKVGPLEKNLQDAETQFRTLQSASVDHLNRAQAGAIFKLLSPLLNEKGYTDPTDRTNKDRIMYRSSLLMSALLARLAEVETDPAAREKRMDASLQLYMNAYLLFSEPALKDLKELLPQKTDAEYYAKIHIPPYEISRENQNQGQVSADVRPNKQEDYYLMQMICGDVLRKSRLKYADMHTLTVNIEREGRLIATGRWDREKDEIVLKFSDGFRNNSLSP